jgi:hypothetical protein
VHPWRILDHQGVLSLGTAIAEFFECGGTVGQQALLVAGIDPGAGKRQPKG